VTNAEFAVFVAATRHVTAAKREGKCWAYFEGGSDWIETEGSDWRHRRGLVRPPALAVRVTYHCSSGKVTVRRLEKSSSRAQFFRTAWGQ
jgi:formylglycine-generating enzyme required for sulfatase activity